MSFTKRDFNNSVVSVTNKSFINDLLTKFKGESFEAQGFGHPDGAMVVEIVFLEVVVLV